MTTRTRFAPSPTGFLHIGGARTALFNWLYAKKQNGEYILRIEDTDRARSSQEFTQDILKSLAWLGINSDVEPIYQSRRTKRYEQAIQQLLEQGDAYYCYCSKERLEKLREQQIKSKQKPRYDGFCRDLKNKPNTSNKPVIRFKNPLDGLVIIEDQVRGHVEIQNSELDDLILARSDGSPTYHLCVVADDLDLKITHVIRGDDHLNNTPRQINIFNALNKQPPVYAHIPLIHGKDGKRLSKRHGAVSVTQYRKEGILPQALLNYLLRLGWSYGDQELFTVKQMIELFDVGSIQKSAATFDYEKLLWVNHQHMKNISGSELRPVLDKYITSVQSDFTFKYDINVLVNRDLTVIYDILKDRSKTLKEFIDESAFLHSDINSYEEKAVKKYFTSDGINILRLIKSKLNTLDKWDAENIQQCIKSVVQELNLKFGEVAPVLRLAVTGKSKSPSIDVTLELLGSVKTLERIDKAIEYIDASV